MADVLTHNIDQIVNRLTTLQRVDLPKATRRTVNQLGFDLARRDVPQYMRAVFDRPNLFTQRSLTYKVVSNYEVQLIFKQNIGKGNDPARYLYPVTKGLLAMRPIKQNSPDTSTKPASHRETCTQSPLSKT